MNIYSVHTIFPALGLGEMTEIKPYLTVGEQRQRIGNANIMGEVCQVLWKHEYRNLAQLGCQGRRYLEGSNISSER